MDIATIPAAKGILFLRKEIKNIGRFIKAANEIKPPRRFCSYRKKRESSNEASEREKTRIMTPKLVHKKPANIPHKKYLSFINPMCSIVEYCDVQ